MSVEIESLRRAAPARLTGLVLLLLACLALASPVSGSSVTGTQAADAPAGLLAARPSEAAPLASPAAPVQSAAGASADRWPVGASQLRLRPFRGIVFVSIGSGTVCTGFVVAPRKVVTAAHCLARSASSGDFRFRRGLPGILRLHRGYSNAAGGSAFASCPVVRVWAHPGFISNSSSDRVSGQRQNDYAVLTTPSSCRYPRNAVLPLWATSANDGQLRSGRQIRLAGYPADPRFAGMNGLNLWRSQGRMLSSSDPALLSVTGFVAQGMSGAPVWRSFGVDSPCGRSQCIVGLITECAVNGRGLCRMGDSSRRAVRITPLVKQAIRDH